MLGGKARERLQPEVSDGEGTEGRVGDEARAGKGRIGTGEWERGDVEEGVASRERDQTGCVWRGGG